MALWVRSKSAASRATAESGTRLPPDYRAARYLGRKLRQAKLRRQRELETLTEGVLSTAAKPKAPLLRLPSAFTGPRVLTRTVHPVGKTLDITEVVTRVATLAQVLAGKKFYPYQVELSRRIVESLLLHDGDVVTSLMSRQAGKSETIGATCASIAIIFPQLAREFPDDWHFNITDDEGNYRGFKDGVKIGIYAPKQEQAEITFERVKRCLETKSSLAVMQELGLAAEINNGTEYSISNGSEIVCRSASEQSKIEGATHHLLIAEEAQDIGDKKMRKSLHPMTASTKGTIVKIGTASTRKCDFYMAIRENMRVEMQGGKRNHYFYPYTVCQRYNSLYREYIEGEMRRIGVDSDEFRMSYAGEFIFERGMFISTEALLNRRIAQLSGDWSRLYQKGLPSRLAHYSLVAGIDWGASNDSTVVTIVAVDWNSPLESGSFRQGTRTQDYVHYKKHVVAWFQFQGDNYEVQYNEIYPLLLRLGISKVVMDSNSCGSPIYARFESAYRDFNIEVEPFNFSAKLKSDGYKSLAGDFAAQRITIPASVETRELREYRRFIVEMLDLTKTYKGGLMVCAHPDERGAHDDYPDSLMMAAWGASKPALTNTAVLGTNPFFS